MRVLLILAVVLLAGCNSPKFVTPTAPTAVAPPVTTPAPAPPPVTPPVTPPPVAPTPTLPPFPPTDSRFDLTFYRQFVHNAVDSPGRLDVLRRQSEAPRIYLRTIDDGGEAIDAFTLNQTAAALENTAGSLTGVFGLAGMERGIDSRQGQRGWITVRWSQFPNERDANYSYCGLAAIGGDVLTLYPKSRFCRCGGGPAVVLSIVKHELGHALGFRHTDSRDDLMFPTYSACDQQPSEREKYHAAVAYTRPIGSSAP